MRAQLRFEMHYTVVHSGMLMVLTPTIITIIYAYLHSADLASTQGFQVITQCSVSRCIQSDLL